MNAYRFGRIRALAMLGVLSCVVTGCDSPPADSASSQDAPQAAPSPAANDAPAPVAAASRPGHRELDPAGTGPDYCILRTVPGGSGQQVLTTMPIVSLPKAEDWSTVKNITLRSFKHDSNCPQENIGLAGSKLAISDSGSGQFEVTITGSGGDLMTQAFRYPNPDETAHAHAYLTAGARCEAGSEGCGALDHYDAYLYVVDVRPVANAKVPKLVLLDLFKPGDVAPACLLERLESAVDERDQPTGCELPDWVLREFPLTASTAAETAMMPAVSPATLQTGTGGGYEPP